MNNITKKTIYTFSEDMTKTIRKVFTKITPYEFKTKFELNETELNLTYEYLDATIEFVN